MFSEGKERMIFTNTPLGAEWSVSFLSNTPLGTEWSPLPEISLILPRVEE